MNKNEFLEELNRHLGVGLRQLHRFNRNQIFFLPDSGGDTCVSKLYPAETHCYSRWERVLPGGPSFAGSGASVHGKTDFRGLL